MLQKIQLFILSLILKWQYLDAVFASTPCPSNHWKYDKSSNTCFYVNLIGDLNYYEAQQFCSKQNYDMAMPKSNEAMKFVTSELGSSGNFWIGLSDWRKKGTLAWEDRSKVGRTFWATPPADQDKEQCIYIDMKPKKWGAANCTDRKYKAACQVRDVSMCFKDNGGCDQHCHDAGPNKRYCTCDIGYTLQGNDCKDIDECEGDNAGCEQTCENTVGSYICKCKSGVPMLSGRVCQSKQELEINSWSAMEIMAVIITVLFPTLSIVGCILMSIWRKRKMSAKASKGDQEPEVQYDAEEVEEEHEMEEEENYEDEDYDEEREPSRTDVVAN